MKTRIISLFSIYLLAVASIYGQLQQNDESNFRLLGKIIHDKPVVKIIPTHPAAWYLGMHKGYKISIAEFQNGTLKPFEVWNENLKPANEEAFLNPSLPQKYAESMRKIIYEEDFVPRGNTFDQMAEASEVMRRLFMGYFLFSTYDENLSALSGLQFQLPPNLNGRYHIKIEIENTAYSYEQIMDISHFAGSHTSPEIEIKQGDKKVKISWNHKKRENQFTAYIVERSTDGYLFESTGTPYIFNVNTQEGKLGIMSITDSIPENYTTFYYRVRGFDAFGELSEPNAAVAVYGRDMTPPDMPTRVQVTQISETHIHVSWTATPSPDLAGFQVIAAESEKGTYHRMHPELLSKNSREFEYKFTQAPLRYYRVLAVDTAGNAAASDLGYLVVYDTIPPQIPTNIQAVADSNHIVTLTWNPSPDSDLKGYRVYKAYQPTHGFIPITPTPITNNVFIDTLSKNRLDKRVYYQVAALDQHFNHSKPSEPVWAAIPDIYPPTAPLLTTTQPDESNHVVLAWKASSSPDVEKYEIMRRLDTDTAYAKIGETTHNNLKFIDSKFSSTQAVYAEYYITAIDSSKNISDPSNAKRVLNISKPTTTNAEIKSIKTDNKQVVITWSDSEKNIEGVLIYRANNDEKYELLDRVNDKNEFVDTSVRSGEKYQYKIGWILKNGSKSLLSPSREIKVN